MTHTPEELMSLYRARFGPAGAHRLRVWSVLVRSYFQRLVPTDSTILDLGCGWGEFINTVRARRRLAMDLNPDAADHLDDDVAFIEQDCAADWSIEEGRLDVVFTSNFLEHLPTKTHLTATLHQAFRSLKPGGTLVCLGPNIRYAPGIYWDFYDHHIPLSERSLSECLMNCGFEIETAIPRFLPFTMSDRPPPPSWMIRLYLFLPPIWFLFGKQFLVIARKPS
ncbi:MAG: class I SAM-dependent methyltransferase [Deltaproteobacteria bacterium]|nr:MAG: class I SAM-dependent methyltransferase [Deltaproteobacteria bacterium]